MDDLMGIVDRMSLSGNTMYMERHRRDSSPKMYECNDNCDCIDCPSDCICVCDNSDPDDYHK